MYQSPPQPTLLTQQHTANGFILPALTPKAQLHIQKQKSRGKCQHTTSLSKSYAYQSAKGYLTNSLQRKTVRNSNSQQMLKRCSTENQIRLSSENLERKLHSESNQNLKTVQSFIRSHKSHGKQNWKALGSPQSPKERQTMGQRQRTHEGPSKKVILKRKHKLTCTQSENFRTEVGQISRKPTVSMNKSVVQSGPCGKKVKKESINCSSVPSGMWVSTSNSVAVLKSPSKTEARGMINKPNQARTIMKEYQFIQQYITLLQLEGLLNEYQLRGEPHCKWGLLAIDETFHRIKGFQQKKQF